MKSRLKNGGTLCALLILWIITGCTSGTIRQLQGGAADSSTHPDAWRAIEPSRVVNLVVASSARCGYTNVVDIRETGLVRSIFQDLTHAEQVVAKETFVVAPLLVAFGDEERNILCSFLYLPAGKPDERFTACRTVRSNGVYVVE